MIKDQIFQLEKQPTEKQTHLRLLIIPSFTHSTITDTYYTVRLGMLRDFK